MGIVVNSAELLRHHSAEVAFLLPKLSFHTVNSFEGLINRWTDAIKIYDSISSLCAIFSTCKDPLISKTNQDLAGEIIKHLLPEARLQTLLNEQLTKMRDVCDEHIATIAAEGQVLNLGYNIFGRILETLDVPILGAEESADLL